MPQEKRHKLEETQRLAEGILSFSGVAGSHALSGFSKPVPYWSSPLTRYQGWLRDPSEDLVSYHYTKTFSKSVVER